MPQLRCVTSGVERRNMGRGPSTNSDSRPLHFVMQLNDVVRKLSYPEQAQREPARPGCKERNACSDEGGHDGDDELVNRVLVQKGGDDLPSPHQPDILASLGAQPPDPLSDKHNELVIRC